MAMTHGGDSSRKIYVRVKEYKLKGKVLIHTTATTKLLQKKSWNGWANVLGYYVKETDLEQIEEVYFTFALLDY